MRVLFVSSSPIQKEISIGNTFLNVFDGIEGMVFASICTKSGKPDPSVSRCFFITEKMLINNLFGKGKAGKELDLTTVQHIKTLSKDSGTTAFVKQRRWNIFFWLQNVLWRIGRWKSPELKAFVEDYYPDIVFTVLSNKIFLNRLIRHVIGLTYAKAVVYAWDNNYSLKKLSFSPFEWITHFCARYHMRKTVAKADKLYVISDVQKQDYEKAFHKPCTVLTKSAEFSDTIDLKTEYNTPLQLVFTGNININRWKSLALIANVLKKINNRETKAELRIYTATPITKRMKKKLDVPGCSYLTGSVPASEIPKIQSEADMLVHVEAMDMKNRLTVRQSFSTKLVDYMKAARPILAVGPEDVASIQHLMKHNCAIIAQSEEELYKKLSVAINNTAELNRIAAKAVECGKKLHNKEQMQKMLINDLKNLLQ